MQRKKLISLVILFIMLLAVLAYPTRLERPVETNYQPPDIQVSEQSFSVLSANVGNANLGCTSYAFKLCDQSVENSIAAGIKALAPDVIGLQEVLADWQCADRDERDPNKVCAQAHKESQIQRLVGPGYTILCDARRNFTCLAVKESFANIQGCAPGDLCVAERTTSEIEGCENNFASLTASIATHTGHSFDVAVLHLPARGPSCRSTVLEELFEERSADFFRSDQLLLMGDINLDPWRANDVSQQTWTRIFEAGWLGRSNSYHSGVAEMNPPHYSLRVPFFDRTLDVLASNFLVGTAQVLGESEGSQRLDGGRGMDHRALFATLYFPEEN
jgi:hypothetical protein